MQLWLSWLIMACLRCFIKKRYDVLGTKKFSEYVKLLSFVSNYGLIVSEY